MKNLTKNFSNFNVKGFSENKTDSGEYGTFTAYASAYDNLDLYGDRVLKGAFDDTVKSFVKSNRKVPLYFNHDIENLPIGGCPPQQTESNDYGLKFVGEINLDQSLQGNGVYSLMKQGVLDRCSFRYDMLEYSRNKYGGCDIKSLALKEISVVTFAANNKADVDISSIKSFTDFLDLPLASMDMSWDSTAAIQRLKDFSDSEDAPSADYKKAFMGYDPENEDKFGSYKFPYADVVNGKLVAVPRAIKNIAAILRGAQNEPSISDAYKQNIISHIKEYYKKMDIPNPWDKKSEYIESFHSMREVEDFLKTPFPLNGIERNVFVSKLKQFSGNRDGAAGNREDAKTISTDINSIISDLKNIKFYED